MYILNYIINCSYTINTVGIDSTNSTSISIDLVLMQFFFPSKHSQKNVLIVPTNASLKIHS